MKHPWVLSNKFLEAIEQHDVENAALLIDCGFDVDSILLEGKSAVSICIERGVPEIAQLLVKRGCSLSLRSPKGDYPLHLAVSSRNIDMVKMLIKQRADITSINYMGQTPIHIACSMSAYDILKILMTSRRSGDHFKIVDRDGTTPFLEACKFANIDVIEYLLPKSAINMCDAYGESPLLACISNPNASAEMMSLLLKAGANVQWLNFLGETPLLKVLRKLCCSFHRNCDNKYVLMALLLIDHKSDVNIPNQIGQTALHLAVCTGNEILVRKLLNAGSKIDAIDEMSFIPLFYAIRNNYLKIVDILIQDDSNLATHDWERVRQNLTQPDSLELIDNIIKCCKQVKSLSALCRTVIRKSVKHSIEEDANCLPIPRSLIKYIKLEK